MNLLSYAKNSIHSFAESPFNRVDALIMCWLSYYCYPDYLKNNGGVALKDIEKAGLLPDKQMYAEAFVIRKSKKLFKYLINSRRFRDIELFDYREEKDTVQEKQFASLCIRIAPNEYFLSFRGTDPSFVGWKEDFNLSCRYPVPSQEVGFEYMQNEMRRFPEGKFYLGGHSKGGNIAVYAAINAEESLQNRIMGVFNFDGPGFICDVHSEQGFGNISDRIIKIVPEASFVGMLLETSRYFSVIKSRSISVFQHDPFLWTVKGNDFKYLSRRTAASVRLEKALNKWVYEFPLDERERIISLIFNALNTLDTKNFNVFFKTFYRQIPALYREYKRLNAEDKHFFDTKLKRLKNLLLSRGAI